MDKKVSVSRFLQQARRTPGANPPPPSPADWRTMKRPTNGTIGFGVLLLVILILIVATLPPRSQSPTPAPASVGSAREPTLAPGPILTTPPAPSAQSVIEDAKWLDKRMAAQNVPDPPPGRHDLVTNKEISDTRTALSRIGKNVPQYAEAQRLLASLARREAEGERLSQEMIAKWAEEEGVSDRNDYGIRLENSLLKAGFDMHIKVSGEKSERIEIRYVLMSRPMVYHIINESEFQSFRADTAKKGFQYMTLTDGNTFYMYKWNPQRTQWLPE
jgi:hypothetical protein